MLILTKGRINKNMRKEIVNLIIKIRIKIKIYTNRQGGGSVLGDKVGA